MSGSRSCADDSQGPVSGLSPIIVTVLAHREERRIALCLESLPLGDPQVAIHLVVNGSKDRTADIGRGVARLFPNLTVHDWAEGGKARSWNRLNFDTLSGFARTHVFVDGDAVVAPGSIAALDDALAANPHANAVSGFPLNGRGAAAYGDSIEATRGLFGDLYALRGDFLARMKADGIRLPVDLIGDDGLIGALAKTDLKNEDHWDDERVLPVRGAGFYCEPVSALAPATLAMQYNRMVNYSVRHLQNRLVSNIMRGEGPGALPERMGSLYAANRDSLRPRTGFPDAWFDRRALRRMMAKS
ncbi:glycosyltransferase [Novosphingopyxis sp. YJ-S2-01]|uniref:glycosyltransferase n=1 Tax=Novosphingopyxis sp. YJ-S2-01 TaxID=2794021 RepID=UPI0018DB5CFD|nr:glycosyltransferase [Novosphingopyxis sp. YJ-S2-01]MBH9537324.1 glycosyltransferase [Novosphingopyxis sp. YJ-S2-01]